MTGKDEELQELQQQFHEIQRAHAEDKSALVKAHEQELAAMAHAADKKALERQLASDEQHKLEIERLVRGRDQAKRALEDHARGVAAEMATLQDMHQQDIRKQTRTVALQLRTEVFSTSNVMNTNHFMLYSLFTYSNALSAKSYRPIWKCSPSMLVSLCSTVAPPKRTFG